ncbi:MAG: WYL domain-containing protein, partial [Actinomycetota bacterium]
RDLEALAMSGVPVYSQAGRGGGWQLIGGATTDLTGLSSGESRALFLALSGEVGRDAVLEGALRKLMAALPEGFREGAEAASTAIKVDPSGWSQVGRPRRPEIVDQLSQLVIDARQCVIAYRRPNDPAATDRVVHPLGLVTKRGVWYLVANTERGRRTYRVDRIHRVEERDEPVVRPDGFDLDEAWGEIVTDVAARWSGLSVRLVVRKDLVSALRWLFGSQFSFELERPDGDLEVTVQGDSPEAMAGMLAGFGAGADPIDPSPELVVEFRRVAAELGDRWLNEASAQVLSGP